MLGNVGGNLISNLIQGWKDKTDADVAREIRALAENDTELRTALDTLLEKMAVPMAAQQ